VVADHTVTSVGGATPYRYIGSDLFTATADAHVLSLANNTPSDDHTVLYDDVAIHQMHLLFADNFNVLQPSQDIQPGGNDEPGRQGGCYAPLTYAEKAYSAPGGSHNHYTQLDNGEFPDALLVAASGGSVSQTTVSPNVNFNSLHPTDGGFASNHIVLEGYGGGALRTHGFDDLEVGRATSPSRRH